jgi:hypothetical protein
LFHFVRSSGPNFNRHYNTSFAEIENRIFLILVLVQKWHLANLRLAQAIFFPTVSVRKLTRVATPVALHALELHAAKYCVFGTETN